MNSILTAIPLESFPKKGSKNFFACFGEIYPMIYFGLNDLEEGGPHLIFKVLEGDQVF